MSQDGVTMRCRNPVCDATFKVPRSGTRRARQFCSPPCVAAVLQPPKRVCVVCLRPTPARLLSKLQGCRDCRVTLAWEEEQRRDEEWLERQLTGFVRLHPQVLVNILAIANRHASREG